LPWWLNPWRSLIGTTTIIKDIVPTTHYFREWWCCDLLFCLYAIILFAFSTKSGLYLLGTAMLETPNRRPEIENRGAALLAVMRWIFKIWQWAIKFKKKRKRFV